MLAAEADLDSVTSKYTAWVYAREGTYTGTGRILGIDRRTVRDTLHPTNPEK